MLQGTTASRHAGRASSRDDDVTGIRNDLQGLRGVGVLAVVIAHLFQWPAGAFAAIDMFFVLSGFLITGLLINAFRRHGRLPFGLFYLSRVRRLVPTAALTIVVTVWLHYVLFSPARGAQVREDGWWALAFGANWRFAQNEADYFKTQTESPLVHFWTLSVEEQFYIAWPLVLLGFLWLAHRSARPAAVLIMGISLVSLASFGYSMWHSVADPAVAYYSTFDRAWEFGAGGLLAAARRPLTRIPPRVGRVMMAVGLTGVLVIVVLLDRTVAFPAPWGLPSVVVCGLVIAGGANRETPFLRALDNRVMVYIGDISYSLYLWHLPAVIVLKPFLPSGWIYFTTTLIVIAGVSVVSYHLVERPMRFAPWLMLSQERDRFEVSVDATHAQRLASGLMVLSGVTAALCLAAFLQVRQAQPAPTVMSLAEASPALGMSLAAVQQQRVEAALEASAFPVLEPAPESLGFDDWAADHLRYGCVDVSLVNVDGCRFGPAGGKSAVVIGDSFAIAWMPGIRKALEPRGWAVQQLTMAQCTTWTLRTYRMQDGQAFPGCQEHHDLVEEYVREHEPDLVILASSQAQVGGAERLGVEDHVAFAEGGLALTLERLESTRSTFVVLSPPTAGLDLLECMTRFRGPDDCVGTTSTDWRDHVAGESAAAAAAGAVYIETIDWFCVADRCPSFVGSTPVTADGEHLTLEFSAQLAPLLRESLLGAVRSAGGSPAARGVVATR